MLSNVTTLWSHSLSALWLLPAFSLVGSQLATPWVRTRLQCTDMCKRPESNLSFLRDDPWTLEDGSNDKTLTKLKLDSTHLPHNLFWASVGIEVKREKENVRYYLTKLEVTDDKCVPRLALGPNIYKLHKGRGPQSSYFSLIPPAVVYLCVCVCSCVHVYVIMWEIYLSNAVQLC